jgi:hypothetical protein
MKMEEKLLFEDIEWYYSFRELEKITNDKKSAKVIGDILKKYSVLTKAWNKEINSEWTCRVYFASKMILNSTVLLLNAEYADKKNMRIVIPYLHYYAVLSLLRSIIYTLPELNWEKGELIEISHTKAINIALDWVSKFNKEKAIEIKKTCLYLKAQRELISYRAPASGDSNLSDNYNIIEICTILAEVVQFNTVLFERSINKNVSKDDFIVYYEDMEKIINVNIEGFSFYDKYDAHRLDYVRRKMPRPYNIVCFMTEGQTEDFIGAWDSEDYDDGNIFNSGSPCNWQLIFNIP